MSKKTILFINGLPDDKKLFLKSISKNGNYTFLYSGSANLHPYLKNNDFDIAYIALDTNPNQEIKLPPIDAIFNQISDADSHKITLTKLEKIHKMYAGKIPFYNTPENIRKTTRDNIYKLLQGIDKLHVPKTVKIQPRMPSNIYRTIEKEGFKFPVIFRQAGDHGGVSTLLIKDDSEVFYTFPLDGRDYYLTQYIEYADKDGMYAKYRLAVVGQEVFMRHAIFSKEWMLHGANLLKEEDNNIYKQPIAEQFINEIKPMITPIVTEISNRLGLEYFGIDCYIDNHMNLLIFEINANMGILFESRQHIYSPQIELIRQALIRMLTSSE